MSETGNHGIIIKGLVITIFMLVLMTFILIIALANNEGNDEIIEPIGVVYHNDGPETKIRYKYITKYETVDEELSSKTNGHPVYSLYVDGEVVSHAYEDYQLSIPSVGETITVRQDETLTSDFYVELNDSVDKDLIRVDVKIIVEELKKGKWTPVYQVAFMERGPYWSLDRGPIEILAPGEEVSE